MVSTRHLPTINCEHCGTTLRFLADLEATRVAANPRLFVEYCKPCQKLPREIGPFRDLY